MAMKRRDFMVAGCAAGMGLMAGCQVDPGLSAGEFPRDVEEGKRGTRGGVKGGRVVDRGPSHLMVGKARVIARNQWTHIGHDSKVINPMGGIARITIHHSGSPKGYLGKTYGDARVHLQRIRAYHRNHRKWADIGYHFSIDPLGNIWECRKLAHQGAHVKNHNAQNIGVMLMGNYEFQKPTGRMLSSLGFFLDQLRGTYGLSMKGVYTHREFNPTSCPGKFLQPRVEGYRKRGFIA